MRADLLQAVTQLWIERDRSGACPLRRAGRTEQRRQIGFDEQVAASPVRRPVRGIWSVRRRAARILQQILARERVEVLLQRRHAFRRAGVGRHRQVVQQPPRFLQMLLRSLRPSRDRYQQRCCKHRESAFDHH